MIVQGNINYTTSGRKRKTHRKVKKAQPAFKPLNQTKPYRRETEYYPSQPMMGVASKPDEAYKQEVSQSYTLAPAYNKGAYQVISKDNIKHIGK